MRVWTSRLDRSTVMAQAVVGDAVLFSLMVLLTHAALLALVAAATHPSTVTIGGRSFSGKKRRVGGSIRANVERGCVGHHPDACTASMT